MGAAEFICADANEMSFTAEIMPFGPRFVPSHQRTEVTSNSPSCLQASRHLDVLPLSDDNSTA
jgi:hypothetical protein